ncbi:MAG: arginine decarboxylase, partial [Bacillota bacterium]|nr:arginine decarboxylase [Bacillota bacterium]
LLKEEQVYPFEETVKKIQNALEGFKGTSTMEPIQHSRKGISELAISFNNMKELKIRDVSFEDAVGNVAGETIIPYPPGIPLMLKGEKITWEMIEQLKELSDHGARFQGGTHLEQKRINIFVITE